MLQTLTCAHGGHSYQRTASRGRKPKFCPQHQPAKPVTAVTGDVETLVCQHGGHEWERSTARGRKPPFCPEHKPVVEKAVKDDETYVMRPEKLRSPLAQKVLSGPMTELRRKMEYVVREIENPRPSRADTGFSGLIYTHKRLLQEAARLYQSSERVVITDDEIEVAA